MEQQKITSKEKIVIQQHTPSGATAEHINWLAMRDFDSFLVGYQRTAGTDVLTSLAISVGDAASPSTTGTVKTKVPASDVDAVNDMVFMEVSAQEVQAAAKTAGISLTDLFVTATVKEVGADDTSTIVYVFGDAHHKADGLTSDVIA